MKKTISLFSANVLFLITLLLIISIGSVIQLLNLSVGLIATEVLLIMLPALWFLRVRGIPLKIGLRLTPIRPGLALISLVLGVAIFLFTVIIEVVMMQLTGMLSVPLPEGSLPSGVLDSILFFLALGVAAPICEEILFRGVIQGAYEQRRRAAFAIILPSLMFAFYHLRLTGLPALLPVAFILGYVAWRTQSLLAPILIHAGVNTTSAVNSLLGIHTGQGLPFISLWSAAGGLLVTLGLLWVIHRWYGQPGMDPVAQEAQPETAPADGFARRAWLKLYWPLAAAGLVYVLVAGLTLLPVLMPELAAATKLTFNPVGATAPLVSEYQITNRGGQVVGQAVCRVGSDGGVLNLACESTQQEYQVQTGSSFFADGEHTARWAATWDSQTLALIDFHYERESPQSFGYRADLLDGAVRITRDGQEALEAAVGADALLEYEWLWRAAALEAPANAVFQAPFGYLAKWDQDQQMSLPVVNNELIRVKALAPLDVPAGRLDAYQVSFGSQTAWYTRSDTGFPRPVQFDNGMVVYSLMP